MKHSCLRCGVELSNRSEDSTLPCPACGSVDRDVASSDGGLIGVKEFVKLALREEGKVISEQRVGDDLFRKTGKWNKLQRIIDYQNDDYFEEIVNPETGEVIRSVKERLSEHRDRGSAKKRSPTDPDPPQTQAEPSGPRAGQVEA
jgi:hypothetical protein